MAPLTGNAGMKIIRSGQGIRRPSYSPVALFGALVIGTFVSMLGILMSPMYISLLVHRFGMPEEDVGIGVVGIQFLFAGKPNVIMGGVSSVAIAMRKSDPIRAAR